MIPTSNNLSEELSQTKSTTEVNDTENLNSENDNKIMNPTNNNIGKMIRPVNGKIIRNFSNKSGGSEGIDYEVAEGTKVKAAAKGTVALVSKSVGDTTIVLLRHDNNIYTVYSNITDVELTRDINVEAGQIIGLVAGGDPSFVHFEVRKGTQAVDPTPYLTQY